MKEDTDFTRSDNLCDNSETAEQQSSDENQVTLDNSQYFKCSRMKSIMAVHSCQNYKNSKRWTCEGCEPDYEVDPSSLIDIKKHLAENPAKDKIKCAEIPHNGSAWW